MVTFSFNLMAIVCVIDHLFFLFTKKDIIVHNNMFPSLGVCYANFPNLKGPRATSQNCKKIAEVNHKIRVLIKKKILISQPNVCCGYSIEPFQFRYLFFLP